MTGLTLEKIQSIFKEREIKTVGEHRYFSVLVPLVQKEDGLFVLYEVRAEHMKRQPGEVCFPGGQVEEGEALEDCAIRETVEELGVKKEDVQIIRQMDIVYTYSNFTMFPFLGTIEEKAVSRMNCNPDEVKETFLVPLDFLMETEPIVYRTSVQQKIGDDFPYEKIKFAQGYQWRKGVSEIPIYEYGEQVIWGLTGRITRNLISVLKEAQDV